MVRTKLFQSNRSQAVRLPKDVAFPAAVREVSIIRDGDRRIIAPASAPWDDFLANTGIDIPNREPARHQERKSL